MQKFSINLYLDDLKPQVHYLTLKNILIAVVLVTLMMMGIGLYLDNERAKQELHLTEIQEQVESAQKNLKYLREVLIKHNDQATFNNQKKMLEKQLVAKEMLWQGVGQRIKKNNVDYYLVMRELTEHHNHDIWLSSFNFNEQSAVFSGYSVDSSSVTHWMTYLQATKSFQGREFSYINVQAVNDQMLSFQVATHPDLVLSKSEEVSNNE